jgi:hypothetical protein
MSVKRRSAQRREGRGFSFGKIEQPAGTPTTSAPGRVNSSRTIPMLSQ